MLETKTARNYVKIESSPRYLPLGAIAITTTTTTTTTSFSVCPSSRVRRGQSVRLRTRERTALPLRQAHNNNIIIIIWYESTLPARAYVRSSCTGFRLGRFAAVDLCACGEKNDHRGYRLLGSRCTYGQSCTRVAKVLGVLFFLSSGKHIIRLRPLKRLRQLWPVQLKGVRRNRETILYYWHTDRHVKYIIYTSSQCTGNTLPR